MAVCSDDKRSAWLKHLPEVVSKSMSDDVVESTAGQSE